MRYSPLASNFIIACVATFCHPAFSANSAWEQATRQFSQGDYRAALNGFQKIAEKMPRDPSVHYMLGQCYKSLNNTSQAKAELEWVSKYATDPRIKGGAITLLSQLGAGGVHGGSPMIAGVVSPYSIAPGGGAASSASAAPQPPSKALLNDSVAQTVAAAYKQGWVPCKGPGCLNYGTSGWHHEKVEGFPDSNMWMVYEKPDGKQYISQLHVGELVGKEGQRMGACPVCHGSGWVAK